MLVGLIIAIRTVFLVQFRFMQLVFNSIINWMTFKCVIDQAAAQVWNLILRLVMPIGESYKDFKIVPFIENMLPVTNGAAQKKGLVASLGDKKYGAVWWVHTSVSGFHFMHIFY
jgi:hypothetical protein